MKRFGRCSLLAGLFLLAGVPGLADPEAGGAEVVQPTLIQVSRVIPDFPEEARKRGVHMAHVTIQAVIETDGTVRDPVVLDCTAPDLGFEEVALAAVAQWRYLPATRDGKPVSVYLTMEVDFGPHAPGQFPGGDQIYYAGDGGVTNPEILPESKAAPIFPDIARKARKQGKVILQVVVEKDGSVGYPAVLQSPGAKFGFDEAAIRAVLQWRYKPALLDGKPVRAWFTIVLDFLLREPAPRGPVTRAPCAPPSTPDRGGPEARRSREG